MIGRRGILGMILGAPVGAAAAASEVVSSASVGVASMDPEISNGLAQISKLDRLYSKARNRAELRAGIKATQVRNMPPHIAERKSWSTAFKHHVALHDRVSETDWWEEKTDKAKRALIREMGLGDLL